MDPEGRKFGVGPRELNGAVDLIRHYKLSAHHDFFCKRPLPAALSETHYLHNLVGDTEIRRGEGMELDQLLRDGLSSRLHDTASTQIRPFDMEILSQAFQLRETTPIDLPSSEKGTPTISGKSKSDSKEKDKDKDKEKKHKKHKDKDREKDKEHKKHKHRHKDKDRSKDKERDKDKERKKDKSSHHDSSGDHSKKHHDKKRKHEGFEDSADNHKHKRSKAQELESR
ncbi:mediator of RNA polymerase II transcription subunit [Rhynchospora pubera]|uniref:Mediator of RNA polymerase II transcription subunit n=1 Tax=Rhynchospora pubera TaxID=906938 RepID=A0AAV8CDV2_9POAL|nr:mediator of RNA polymerase II transcription subunit [Rhynchospora pubera]